MSSTMNLPFGTLLKRHRRAARLTQGELAEQAGYSTSYISMLERGERLAQPSAVEILAETLGLDTADRAAFLAANRQQAAALANTEKVSPSPPAALEAPTPTVETATAVPVAGEAPAAASAASAAGAAIHTFLIADVRGYTRYTLEHGDEEAARLAARFATLVRTTVGHYDGQLLELRGDEALVVFTSARQALRAAVALQARFVAQTPTPLAVGIGLDAGEAVPVADGGYRGAALNLAARLCSLAGPGEVLASEGVIHLARVLPELHYTERGQVQLKGFADLVRVIHITPAGAEAHEVPAGAAPASAAVTAVEQASTVVSLPIGGFLGALPEGELVAREQEREHVVAALAQALGGAGQLVLLAGEPGVGKTRLAQEVTREARNRGAIVATGRCYAPEQAVGYYPFIEVLARLAEAAAPAVRTSLTRRWPDLARLLPEGQGDGNAAAASGPLSSGREEQQRLFWQVTQFVLAIAQTQALAILLDDLHWADEASLALLQHLARHTRGARVLLLGTYRDSEVRGQMALRTALSELAHEHLSERIAIGRFTVDETVALLATTLGAQGVTDSQLRTLAERVHEPTAGNAYFVREVVRALVERGAVYQEADGTWQVRTVEAIAVPESVRATLEERLSRLAPSTQELLHLASILGQTFTFDDLWHMQERTEEEVEVGLAEADATGLLRAAEHESYFFNHALTQRALYSAIPARRRRRLHAAAATAIEQLPERARLPRAAELAGHWLAADERARALPYVLAAGDQAEAVFAHGEAERQYRVAVEIARDVSDAAREAEALEHLGDALLCVGQVEESLTLWERAIAAYEVAGNREGAWRCLAQVGQYFPSPTDALARLEPLIASLADATPTPALAALYWSLAWNYWRTPDILHLHLPTAQKAEQVAHAAHDDRQVVRALLAQTVELAPMGEGDEVFRLCFEALPLSRRVGDPWAHCQLVTMIAFNYVVKGQFAAAQPFYREGLETAERIAVPHAMVEMYLQVCEFDLYRGAWAEARAGLDKATTLMSQLSDDVHVDQWMEVEFMSLWAGVLELAAGHQAAALTKLVENLHVDKEGASLFEPACWAQIALAEGDLIAGDAAAAQARLEPFHRLPPFGMNQMKWRALLAWAYLDQGETERARLLAEEAIALADQGGWDLELVDALRVRAQVAIQQRRWDDAASALDDTISRCQAMPCPYAEAKALYVYGQLYTARGETERARERYEAALAILNRLGERLYAEHIERALAALPGV